ncbi:glycosyltransferase family 4 protein [Stenomitos frigidus]|uniref:Glycosyl transferase group 1 n=1 Tax=Stenomitos frigidus ULC18 TaxID=2107698 RepID=A0A2T1DYP1_9CYAN|nr:glycosyltransferase family 1 protein [Stenomitos frigidus]PSB25600.1 glycosyl transferase group 1 [Stenomitos frigidus ULC18]
MRVAIVRPMPNFSMDTYADGLIAGLTIVRPDWEITELVPHPADRRSRSIVLRAQKAYERFWRFPHAVAQQPADLVHIIDHSEAHIVRWVKKRGIPVVVTCHDLINFFYRDNLQGSVQVPFVSTGLWQRSVRGMSQANHVVTVSAVTAYDTTQLLDIDPSHITVVPNAVEPIFQPTTPQQTEALRQQQGASAETICLLNVGSNHPRKNLIAILQALASLVKQGLPVQFWKVSADFTDEQKAFIRDRALEPYIRYLGNPDKAALVKIYSAADVLVAPSLHEGFGLTLLEAMACGTPVITANCSAMPEVAGDAGILVDPNDSQAIANAVTHLHNDPAFYQSLVVKGLDRAKQFTWENTAAQVAQVYEQLLRANRDRTLPTVSMPLTQGRVSDRPTAISNL